MGNSLKGFFVWITAIAIGISTLSACGSADRDDSGAVVEEGSVSAWSIQVGDCLTDTFGGDNVEFSYANVIPCDQPHAFEAYHGDVLSGDTFPTDINTTVDDICYYAFADFIGITVEETYLTYSSLLPTQVSWENDDDREVTCIVGMEDGSEITGTLRNSG
jgi:hypothetical protein